jgi:hypothetical protein
MAQYAGVTGLYKTAAGYVPAVTTAHRNSSGAIVDVAIGSADSVDIVTLGYQPTRVSSVDVAAGTNFAARLTNDTGSFWVPA